MESNPNMQMFDAYDKALGTGLQDVHLDDPRTIFLRIY